MLGCLCFLFVGMGTQLGVIKKALVGAFGVIPDFFCCLGYFSLMERLRVSRAVGSARLCAMMCGVFPKALSWTTR